MEKAMYPSKYIRITQKDHQGSHSACWAVDEAGKDGGIGNIIAPFTGIVKKIYAYSNEVWLQSKNKVKYADGTEDYMTILFCHDNSVTSLYVGKEIKAGTIFYQEGTKGNAQGNHLHFECGKGKFSGTGWYQDKSGAWSIINGKKVTECLWIDDTYTIKDTAGYKFRNTKEVEKKYVGTPVKRNEDVEQVEVFETTTILNARKTPNGEVLGYMNSGIYNLLERKLEGNYEWFKVEKDVWFAYSKDWCEFLPKKEEPIEPPKPIEPEPTIEELQKRIDELEYQVSQLNAVQEVLEKENADLKKKLEDQPMLVFTAPKLDYYAIKLEAKDELYIKRAI